MRGSGAPGLLAEFPEWQRSRGIQEKTLADQLSVLRAHTLPDWAEKRLDSLCTQEIRDLLAIKVGSRSPGHQQYVLKCIRSVFRCAVERRLIPVNPTPEMKFRRSEKLKGVLTEGQIRVLLEKARELNSEWFPHWALALYTGMRTGELHALTWDQVNLERGKITVKFAWNSKDGIKSTKSGHDRMVEIAPGLRPILMELKQMYPESQFVLPRLSQWDKGEQARELRAFLMGIGLPPVRFHDLRASWATLLLNKGVAPAAVMGMGGWRDPKTMFVYLRKAGIDIQGATRCLNFGGSQPAPSGLASTKQLDNQAAVATPHLRLVTS